MMTGLIIIDMLKSQALEERTLSLYNIQLVAKIKTEQKTIQKWLLVPPVNREEFLVKSKPKKIIKATCTHVEESKSTHTTANWSPQVKKSVVD